jgi:hypothetical protein
MPVRVAQLDPGRNRQLAGELGPALLHAAEVTVDVERGRLVDVAVYLAADSPDELRCRVGDHQRGQVCVIGKGHRRQADLDRTQARVPHRPLQRVGPPLCMHMLVSRQHRAIFSPRMPDAEVVADRANLGDQRPLGSPATSSRATAWLSISSTATTSTVVRPAAWP